LVAEVQVKNEDVGFVQPGQQVQLKLAAYPFQKYGLMQGTVQTVAADAQAAAQNNGINAPLLPNAAGYKAIVKLKTQQLETHSGDEVKRYPLEPGMQVAAEINQGHRTVMEYLLSPVSKAVHEAGRER
jgi:hemolysin D